MLVRRYMPNYCGYRHTFRSTELTGGVISASFFGFNLLVKVIFYKSTRYLTNHNTSNHRRCGLHYKAQKCLTFLSPQYFQLGM